jgi:hypothetical protein
MIFWMLTYHLSLVEILNALRAEPYCHHIAACGWSEKKWRIGKIVSTSSIPKKTDSLNFALIRIMKLKTARYFSLDNSVSSGNVLDVIVNHPNINRYKGVLPFLYAPSLDRHESLFISRWFCTFPLVMRFSLFDNTCNRRTAWFRSR